MINEIIDNNDKYYYYIGSTSKTVFLSSDNDKKIARQKALEKLAPGINNLIGKHVILVTLKDFEKKYLEKKDEKFNVIGGPIAFQLEQEVIKSSSKISSGDKSRRYVYLSNKYIKKNKDNIIIKLKEIVNDYKNNKLNCQQGVFCMSIL